MLTKCEAPSHSCVQRPAFAETRCPTWPRSMYIYISYYYCSNCPVHACLAWSSTARRASRTTRSRLAPAAGTPSRKRSHARCSDVPWGPLIVRIAFSKVPTRNVNITRFNFFCFFINILILSAWKALHFVHARAYFSIYSWEISC